MKCMFFGVCNIFLDWLKSSMVFVLLFAFQFSKYSTNYVVDFGKSNCSRINQKKWKNWPFTDPVNWSIKFFAILFLEQMISFSYRCVIRAGNSATGKRQSCSAETHHGDHGGSTHQSSVKCQDSKFTECIKIYEPHPQPTWYTVLQMTPCLCYFFMVYLW